MRNNRHLEKAKPTKSLYRLFVTIMVLAMLGLFTTCVNSYNPFSDPTNAKIILDSNSTGITTKPLHLFKTDTLYFQTLVFEQIDSITIQRQFHLGTADSTLYAPISSEFILQITPTDTGNHTVRITVYRPNGQNSVTTHTYRVDPPPIAQADTFSVDQQRLYSFPYRANPGTWYHLAFSDKQWHWDQFEGNIQLDVPKTYDSVQIWFSADSVGVQSPSPIFYTTFVVNDHTPPSITTLHPQEYIRNDTLLTSEFTFHFQIRATDKGGIHSVRLNNLPFQIQNPPRYWTTFRNVHQSFRDSAAELIVDVTDQAANTATDTFYLRYDENIPSIGSARIIIDTTQFRVAGSLNYQIMGEVIDLFHDSLKLTLKVNETPSGDTTKVVLKQHYATWSLPVKLQGEKPNSITLQAVYENEVLDEKFFSIIYDESYRDTSAPFILSVTSNNRFINTETVNYISDLDQQFVVEVFDESPLQNVFVNTTPLSPELGTQAYRGQVTLSGSDSTIQITAIDSGGKSTTKFYTFRYNITPSFYNDNTLPNYLVAETPFIDTLEVIDNDSAVVLNLYNAPPAMQSRKIAPMLWEVSYTPSATDTGLYVINLLISDGKQDTVFQWPLRIGLASQQSSSKAQLLKVLSVKDHVASGTKASFIFRATTPPEFSPYFFKATLASNGRDIFSDTIVVQDSIISTVSFSWDVPQVDQNMPEKLFFTLADARSQSDTASSLLWMEQSFTILPPNKHPVSLVFLNDSLLDAETNILNMANHGSEVELQFRIQDKDAPLTEAYSVMTQFRGFTSQRYFSSATDFTLIVQNRCRCLQELFRVIVEDKTNTSDTVNIQILFPQLDTLQNTASELRIEPLSDTTILLTEDAAWDLSQQKQATIQISIFDDVLVANEQYTLQIQTHDTSYALIENQPFVHTYTFYSLGQPSHGFFTATLNDVQAQRTYSESIQLFFGTIDTNIVAVTTIDTTLSNRVIFDTLVASQHWKDTITQDSIWVDTLVKSQLLSRDTTLKSTPDTASDTSLLITIDTTIAVSTIKDTVTADRIAQDTTFSHIIYTDSIYADTQFIATNNQTVFSTISHIIDSTFTIREVIDSQFITRTRIYYDIFETTALDTTFIDTLFYDSIITTSITIDTTISGNTINTETKQGTQKFVVTLTDTIAQKSHVFDTISLHRSDIDTIASLVSGKDTIATKQTSSDTYVLRDTLVSESKDTTTSQSLSTTVDTLTDTLVHTPASLGLTFPAGASFTVAPKAWDLSQTEKDSFSIVIYDNIVDQTDSFFVSATMSDTTITFSSLAPTSAKVILTSLYKDEYDTISVVLHDTRLENYVQIDTLVYFGLPDTLISNDTTRDTTILVSSTFGYLVTDTNWLDTTSTFTFATADTLVSVQTGQKSVIDSTDTATHIDTTLIDTISDTVFMGQTAISIDDTINSDQVVSGDTTFTSYTVRDSFTAQYELRDTINYSRTRWDTISTYTTVFDSSYIDTLFTDTTLTQYDVSDTTRTDTTQFDTTYIESLFTDFQIRRSDISGTTVIDTTVFDTTRQTDTLVDTTYSTTQWLDTLASSFTHFDTSVQTTNAYDTLVVESPNTSTSIEFIQADTFVTQIIDTVDSIIYTDTIVIDTLIEVSTFWPDTHHNLYQLASADHLLPLAQLRNAMPTPPDGQKQAFALPGNSFALSNRISVLPQCGTSRIRAEVAS